MAKLNPFKIYALAIFHLLMPKKIKRMFHFKTSAIENLAVGTTMSKIWYWKSLITNRKMEKKIYYTNKFIPDNSINPHLY